MITDDLARGSRVAIRSLRQEDRAEFTRLARANAELHRPWLAPPTTDAEFDAYLARFEDPAARACFVICLAETGELAGYVAVNNIVHGAFRCGALGYGAFVAGRGLVAEGVDLVIRHAFTELGLHRLEVNVQPENLRSIALAKRLGFRLEGFSPDFLFIDGAWRGHERWAITADMVDGLAQGPLRRAATG
ncbi:ribosomal-protein-alanine N-acetyltransferase [Kitasatospora sp. GAS204A]|uniref:GNAT family N-acetyltransferase n=1 Tax=unclassified Kitasatospora TaxID=2633591 RepID=UPI0024766EDD|nr:GNAT family protein [Kitasatospora sp. GAS204B]MDH6120372.1 ribosomal-protein-alanine N-acetyltransferase [Kitasatospora sp. GAS204B]